MSTKKFDIEGLPSAWKGHRSFAVNLVKNFKPKVIVDLGVDYGYSLFALAEAGIGQVYGIDSFDGDVHAGHHSDACLMVNEIINLDYKNITLVKGYFDDVVKTWDKTIDILHIDGLHTYEAVKNDYLKWSPHVRPGGIILFHDTVAFPEVGRFFNEIPGEKTHFEHSAGLGVVITSPDAEA